MVFFLKAQVFTFNELLAPKSKAKQLWESPYYAKVTLLCKVASPSLRTFRFLPKLRVF